VTSRSPREGEADGVDYYFVSEQLFKQKIAANEFFEYENVHGKYYGTLKKFVTDSLSSGTDLLLDIDIKGAITFKKQLPKNTVILFLLPPSVDVLKARIINRGSMQPSDLEKRLKTAEQEYKTLLDDISGTLVDYVLINEDLNLTCSTVGSILTAERNRLTRLNREILKEVCAV
jgi:guanylate kinase